MFAAASTAVAQNPSAGTERKTYTVPCEWKGDSQLIVKRYGESLKSDNQGVVEATLAHIIWMRVAATCMDVTPLQADVERLAVKGAPASLRFRAYLTAMVLEDPESYKALAQREFAGPNELFAGVTNLMYAAESADLYSVVADGQ